ncbi:hypothetical protein OSB04_010416 [Centaurea solstitialis]|uniref:Uncharacterized protein n=1 Tax=Centaurea solstitialis TaxID=347529 RepID=A0AA38WBX9_9ASTR|nr:hypothetical protein OSB04_010416 [Centaurea solstitialis]
MISNTHEAPGCHHLDELKRRLLKDGNQVFDGFSSRRLWEDYIGKEMVCHDNEVKGIFGDNIFYVTVSRMATLKGIVQKLFVHHLHENHFQAAACCLIFRKDASELEGYCNEHYVMQHD